MNTDNPTPPVPRKYVHVEGRAEIAYDPDIDRLTLTFLDENLKPIASLVPLVFSKKKSEESGEERLAIKFKHVHLIASLSEKGYTLYGETLKTIDPFTEDWAKLEESDNSGDMNTTDPPSN